VYGGTNGPPGDSRTKWFSDLWKFDFGQRSWQQVAVGKGGPSYRFGASAVFTNGKNSVDLAPMLLFGGYGKQGLLNDLFVVNTNDPKNVVWSEVVQPGCTVGPPEPRPSYPSKGNTSNGTSPAYDSSGDIGLAFTVVVIGLLAIGAGFMMFRRYNLLGFGSAAGDGSRQSMLSHDSESVPVSTKDSYGTSVNMNPHPSSWN
jgi:hypothetical protein